MQGALNTFYSGKSTSSQKEGHQQISFKDTRRT